MRRSLLPMSGLCLFAILGRGPCAQQVVVVTGGQAIDGPAFSAPPAEVQWLWPEAPPATAPKWTLWFAYPGDGGACRDHRQYLADLQRRFGERGVRIAVITPPGQGKALAAGKPAFAVGEAADWAGPPGSGLFTEGATPLVPILDPDDAVDLLQAAVDDTLAAPAANEALTTVPALLYQVGDGGDFKVAAAHCLELLPHSGRARALAVLVEWWCTGDVVAARQAAVAGMRALADEAVPLCEFADLVLRGDKNDPSLAKELAVLLAPAAAAAPDGVFTQLVYLRALLLAGQDKLAGRVAATTAKLVAGSPARRDQILLAETLMEASQPAVFRDLAERALATARERSGDDDEANTDARWLCAARHKVLARCGAKAEEIEQLLADYRKSRSFENSLNNDAWYLIVRPDTMGRFDTLALAQCEEMQRQEGDSLSNGSKDTVALALFVNGMVERALELQKVATAASQNDPEYVGRLTRYQNTLAARAGKK